MSEGAIRRTGPPQAIQKVRDDAYLVQVPLSAAPTADWRRLFYETQHDVPADFPPRAIEISGPFLRFRSAALSVGARIAMIDRWLERANQKEAAMAGRSDEHRRRREELAREQRELAELNARWTGL
ncbi:MAG TPA: hypothetical protein VGS20_15825 [Candidatus Acidoferrales bacterium]|nr:hypothetical protein [Candidatus Acidoferrales bacterium]